jgi:hypothetical protein
MALTQQKTTINSAYLGPGGKQYDGGSQNIFEQNPLSAGAQTLANS